MRKKCPYCGIEVVTYVEHELSHWFWFACVGFLIMFGLYGFLLMPIAYVLMKNAVHRCSRCLSHLGTKTNFGMPDFKSEILHFNLGKGVIVVSRGIGILVFSLIFIVFIYFAWFTQEKQEIIVSKVISSTWLEYTEDCGS